MEDCTSYSKDNECLFVKVIKTKVTIRKNH